MPSQPSPLPHESGLRALSQELAPSPVQVTFCAGNALPFRVEWRAAKGPVTFYGLSPDDAAAEALSALGRGSVDRPARAEAITDPVGDTPWAEAMREYIVALDEQRTERRRPTLRIVRS